MLINFSALSGKQINMFSLITNNISNTSNMSKATKMASFKTSVFSHFKIISMLLLRSFAIFVVLIYLWSVYDFSLLAYSMVFANTRRAINWSTWWVFIDIVFFGLVELRFRGTKSLDHIPLADNSVLHMILRELDDERSVGDVKKFMEGWFFGTKMESLYKGDIMSWVSAMFFNKKLQNLSSEQLENVELVVGRFEEKLGYLLPEGIDHKSRKMMVTLDPVSLCHRPLFFYAAVKCLDVAARSALWNAGFIRSTDRGVITYLKQGSRNETPLVFFHGIGIGLFPYIRLIWAMVAKFPHRTIILFEKTSISMRLDRTLLLPEEYAHKIHFKLKEARIEKIVVVGHSLGTICIRWIDYYYPDIIQSRVFIDPVCFTLWTHDIAQNFMYRSPNKIRHYLLKYLASMEPGISLYLRRYFV